ncbi:hypothetical protein BH11PSE4_BH11PSE4_37860 [soil metagenome]
MTTCETTKPLTFSFYDDGLVPNSTLPLLVYRSAAELGGSEPERVIERLFEANGWGQMWRNGIYDYQHYHATVHEALGVARGHALVLFGGEQGEAVEMSAGDIVVLPAGTGHKCLFASHDLSVVVAYPPGSQMHVTLPTPENYRRALKSIPAVSLPESDPVNGARGPLTTLWTQSR